MDYKRNSIWDVEIDTFMSLDTRFRRLHDNGVEYVYIYPYGERGMYIQNYLEKRFSFKKVVCVDEKLNKYNKNILTLEELKNELENIDITKAKVILSSDNPEIFIELRLCISDFLPVEMIMDVYWRNPLELDKDRRIASLAQVARQIYRNNVAGSVAEVGVYQGEFARYLNMLFPRKKLFLFDTFSGFEESMVVNEDDKNQTDRWIDLLKDTSMDLVLSKLPYKEQTVICKGVFPDTAKGINETFSFVNLDIDLYDATYRGLNYFWNRLNAGGYIFVHDFEQWVGVTKAVTQFCKENNIGYVILPDCITACLAKPL